MNGDRARAETNRRLTPEQFEAWISQPVSAAERDEVLDLVRWFRRRYPRPLDRLAYVRRAHARWTSRRSAT